MKGFLYTDDIAIDDVSLLDGICTGKYHLADKVTKCFGLNSVETSTSLARQRSKRFHGFSQKRHT